MNSASNGSVLRAEVLTTQGTFEVELFPGAAPRTVANFVELAKAGFYDDLVWHRIVKGFAIQIGDPTSRNAGGNPLAWGSTGSPKTVPLEASRALVAEGYANRPGYLGMARTADPNSGSSQFFINLGENDFLNGQYTVFGRVVTGMDVVQSIGDLPVSPDCASSGGMNCQPLDPKNARIIGIKVQGTP